METKSIARLTAVKISERKKNGFISLNGLTPEEKKAISSWLSLCFENKETTDIKNETERAINKTFGSESMYILKSSKKVMCMFDVMFAIEIIIMMDVIKKSIEKIVRNIGQKPDKRYFESLSIY